MREYTEDRVFWQALGSHHNPSALENLLLMIESSEIAAQHRKLAPLSSMSIIRLAEDR